MQTEKLNIHSTNLVELPLQTHAKVFLKMESEHPSGSLKERPAFNMLKRAIEQGTINEKTHVVEASSGNTGIGTAWACTLLDLNCTIFLPQNTPAERIRMLNMLKCNLVFTPAAEGMTGSILALQEKLKIGQNLYYPNQFSNPANPEAHSLTTGPEIWAQTHEKVDFIIAGSGSGGTISGCSRFLKEKNPSIKTFAIEPEQSFVLRGGHHNAHAISGIAPGFVPKNYHSQYIDEVFPVSETACTECINRMDKKFGMKISMSTAANISTAIHFAQKEENTGKNIVTFVCENADIVNREHNLKKYLS